MVSVGFGLCCDCFSNHLPFIVVDSKVLFASVCILSLFFLCLLVCSNSRLKVQGSVGFAACSVPQSSDPDK